MDPHVFACNFGFCCKSVRGASFAASAISALEAWTELVGPGEDPFAAYTRATEWMLRL